MSKTNIGRRDFVVTGLAAGVAAGAVASSLTGDGLFMRKAHAAEGGRLTLHAIDTYFGQTKAGLRIDLSVMDGDMGSDSYKLIKTVETVERGRTENPLLEGDDVKVGRYELLMHLDDYFAAHAMGMPTPPFLGKVHIRFGLYDAAQKFHVPILFSPWSYSYYRGS